MSDVKRYDMSGFGGGLVESEEGAWYHMDDYAKLEAEAQALREERDSQQRIAIKAMEEVAALRHFAGEIYQVLGALDAPENVMDNASDAASGDKMRHKTLLPFAALRARVVVPDGYALVPVEPTVAMRMPWKNMRGHSWYSKYRCMLEAAPRLNGKVVSEGLLRESAELLEGYAEVIRGCKADEIERFDYLPSVEGAAEELRALLGEGKET